MNNIDKDEVITVKELIEFLKQFPDDAEVWVIDRNGLSNEAKTAYQLNDMDVIIGPI